MTITFEQRAIRDRHAKVMLPVLAGCALLGLFWKPDISTQVLMLIVGVGTIGLGHGAMDHRVGEILMKPRFRHSWPIIFALSYLMLAAIGLAGWIVAPTVGLFFFLVYSALHFGSDQFQAKGIAYAVARGAIPLLLPIAFQPGEVSDLFSIVAGVPITVEPYVFIAGSLATVAILISITSSVRRREFIYVAEVVTLIAINIITPPLIAFTLYFVLLHSIRHIIELAGWLEQDSLSKGFRRIARESLPITFLVVLAGILGSSQVRVADIEPTLIQLIFVGLSCLTIPHMVVTHLGEKQFAYLDVLSQKESRTNY